MPIFASPFKNVDFSLWGTCATLRHTLFIIECKRYISIDFLVPIRKKRVIATYFEKSMSTFQLLYVPNIFWRRLFINTSKFKAILSKCNILYEQYGIENTYFLQKWKLAIFHAKNAIFSKSNGYIHITQYGVKKHTFTQKLN